MKSCWRILLTVSRRIGGNGMSLSMDSIRSLSPLLFTSIQIYNTIVSLFFPLIPYLQALFNKQHCYTVIIMLSSFRASASNRNRYHEFETYSRLLYPHSHCNPVVFSSCFLSRALYIGSCIRQSFSLNIMETRNLTCIVVPDNYRIMDRYASTTGFSIIGKIILPDSATCPRYCGEIFHHLIGILVDE